MERPTGFAFAVVMMESVSSEDVRHSMSQGRLWSFEHLGWRLVNSKLPPQPLG